MYKDYSKYNAIDFIQDDFFIESIQRPTNETERFWKKLIISEKIDSNEFINAYQILKEMNSNRPEVEKNRIDALWLRIQKTNARNKSRKHTSLYLKFIAAASVLLIFGLLYVFVLKNQDIQLSGYDFAGEITINKQNSGSEIKLISKNATILVDGDEARLEYDEDGNLLLNDETIKVKESKKIEPELQQLVVPYGKRAFITLSDGTKLWVNTGTTVIFPVTFEKSTREIFVDGEIYADVFHNENKPFIVKTKKLEVQVLGTQFNLSAYSQDNQVNVVLVSGSVNVRPEKGKPTTITPNQMYSLTEQAASLRTVEVDKYISWIDGVYIFKNEPIEDILIKLSRYYNVTMKLPNYPSGINCSGKLELKEDLNELLNGLSEITSMSYGVQDGEYKVKFR
jgi:transmembrane sensor